MRNEWGEDRREGLSEKRTSSPQPSPPSDGGEGEVSASPSFGDAPRSLGRPQADEGEAGTIHSKLNQAPMINFRDIYGASVRPAEAKIARFRTQHVHFTQHLSGGREFHDRALAVTRDVKIAVHVAAHSIEAVRVEFFEEPFVSERSLRINGERPD